MASFLIRFTNGIRKHPYLTINIILGFWYAVFMAVLIVVLCTNNVIPELKTTTGTIASIKHHDRTDPDLIDHLLNDTASYLNIKLADGESYQANGVRYEYVDRELFKVLKVDTEIKLIYEDKGFGGGIDLIYGIEYYGKTYLAVDDALTDLKSERKITLIVCPVIMGVLTLLAGVGVFFNYRKFKRKPKENKENSEL